MSEGYPIIIKPSLRVNASFHSRVATGFGVLLGLPVFVIMSALLLFVLLNFEMAYILVLLIGGPSWLFAAYHVFGQSIYRFHRLEKTRYEISTEELSITLHPFERISYSRNEVSRLEIRHSGRWIGSVIIGGPESNTARSGMLLWLECGYDRLLSRGLDQIILWNVPNPGEVAEQIRRWARQP